MVKIMGKTVRNSARSLQITVTADDERNATPLEPDECVAAQCIKRTLKADDVRVHRGVVYILNKGAKTYQRYKTSGALRLETIIYDRGGRFMMGQYNLIAPSPSMIVGSSLRKQPAAGAKGKAAKLRLRRQVIPGVRRTATARKTEGDDNAE